jgi:hypothetical protein
MDLRWGLPAEIENLTVQKLDFVLRSGISKGAWQFYSKIDFLTVDTLPQGFPCYFQNAPSPKVFSDDPFSERSIIESGFCQIRFFAEALC